MAIENTCGLEDSIGLDSRWLRRLSRLRTSMRARQPNRRWPIRRGPMTPVPARWSNRRETRGENWAHRAKVSPNRTRQNCRP